MWDIVESHPSNYHTSDGRGSLVIFSRLTVFLFLLLGTVLSAACNSQPAPTADATSPPLKSSPTPTSIPATQAPTATITPLPTSALEITTADLNGITLKFWHPWSGDTENAIQGVLAGFNASNPYGINVEAISHGDLDSLYAKIDVAQLETGLPNLAVGTNFQIQSWFDAGKPIVGLDSYVNDPEWGFSDQEMEELNEIFLQQDIQEGNRFGLPAVRSSQLMYYNRSWAEELGFSSPPLTTEQFKAQVCAAAQANQSNAFLEDDGTGGWLINTSPSGILSWLYAFDSPVMHPGGDGYQFNTPESETALRFLKDLLDEGCAFELLESPAEVEFANRRALMVTSSLSNISYQKAELVRAENNDEWTVTGFPSPGGEPAISVYGPSYFMLAGTAEENLAAWLLIKWLLLPENDARLVEARGTFPINSTTMDLLEDYADDHPQWAAAQDLLRHAEAEPGLESWGRVRWILGDVGTQIFRYYFTVERIPATLELMDETAAELHYIE